MVHVLVAQHFALGLPELGLEAIILLLDSLRLLLADRVVKLVFQGFDVQLVVEDLLLCLSELLE